jgi:glycosyltransferase involved in cell wall biosynthesis
MEFLLSVVIPTKNRYSNLIPLISALVERSSSELEIVIEDNSEDNEIFLKFYENMNSKNIKYFYCKEWRSVGTNSDQAILHSTGKYVMFIGDDDAFVRQTIDVVKIMDEFNIDSCGCDYSYYRWPTALGNGKNSFEYMALGDLVRWPNLDKEISKIMKNGIQGKRNLPGVYHGIVRRDILNKIYERAGSFFPGPSPDMSNSFALSFFVKKHMILSIPFVIDGYSKASTGHLTEEKKHIGKLEDQIFLPKETINEWTEQIPKIWLPNTIWPESAIQAIKKCGYEELFEKFNYTAMYIKISHLYPQCRAICKEYIRKYSGWIKWLLTYIGVVCSFIRNRAREKKSLLFLKKIIFSESMSIEDAIKMTERIIVEKQMIELLDKKMENYRRGR